MTTSVDFCDPNFWVGGWTWDADLEKFIHQSRDGQWWMWTDGQGFVEVDTFEVWVRGVRRDADNNADKF